jgi:hypothetical protein
MLVKDLLILFQAGNEGVINVLGLFPIPICVFLTQNNSRTLFRDVQGRRCPGPVHISRILLSDGESSRVLGRCKEIAESTQRSHPNLEACE